MQLPPSVFSAVSVCLHLDQTSLQQTRPVLKLPAAACPVASSVLCCPLHPLLPPSAAVSAAAWLRHCFCSLPALLQTAVSSSPPAAASACAPDASLRSATSMRGSALSLLLKTVTGMAAFVPQTSSLRLPAEPTSLFASWSAKQMLSVGSSPASAVHHVRCSDTAR